MLFTDQGTKVDKEYVPLAFANGAEWMSQRRDMPDRFDNLYRSKLSVNGLLWYLGAFLEFIFPS